MRQKQEKELEDIKKKLAVERKMTRQLLRKPTNMYSTYKGFGSVPGNVLRPKQS